MKKFFQLALVLTLAIFVASCGGKKAQDNNKFAGSFTDEFHNEFTLNDDHTATIKFAGEDSAFHTKWSDGTNHDQPYATIQFNGDPTYYYLRDGKLYRHQEDMEKGTCAIKITYDN